MSALKRWSAHVDSFDHRGRLFAAGRSLLGVAQLSILVANPESLLFGATSHTSADSLCRGTGSLTLWCVAGSGNTASTVAEAVAGIVLVGVISGLWPRWLCLPHCYVAFSIATRITVGNGGDAVAQILAALLVPCCLGDSRTWHWRQPAREMDPVWRGVSCAAHLVIRGQILIIYLNAALAKLGYSAWRDGSAVRTLLEEPGWGLPAAARSLIVPLLSAGWASVLVTWGAVATELGIALAVLGSARIRRGGLRLAVCLHTAIILAFGLFSFGLIMIAVVMVGAERGQRSAARFPTDPKLVPQMAAAEE